MKRLMSKVKRAAAVLAAMAMCFCACAPAASAQETGGYYRKVTNEAELAAAVQEAKTLADAAHAQGVLMEMMTIELCNDIDIVNEQRDIVLHLNAGGNVRITSTQGKQYRLRSSNTSPYGFPLVGLSLDSELTLDHVTVDGGSQSGGKAYLGIMAGGKLTLGRDAVIQNFDSSTFVMALTVTESGKERRYAPQLVMHSARMQDNRATACMFKFVGGSFDVRDSKLSNNICASWGGVFSMTNGAVYLKNNTFTANASIGGGAVHVVKGTLQAEDCVFEKNRAEWQAVGGGEGGGAVNIQNDAQGAFTNCTFTQNYSDLGGGAVQVYINSDATFDGCTFVNNTAETHGAAICVADSFSKDDTLASTVKTTNTLFEGNVANALYTGDHLQSDPFAPGGGAIYLHEYCEAELGQGTVLRQNRTPDKGGAVYACFGSKVTIDGALLENNRAGTHGGAVYVDGTGAYAGYDHSQSGVIPGPDDGYATGGKLYFKDGRIAKNTAGRNGGGVYIGGENMVEVDGETLEYTGGEVQMTGGVITENKAMDMGGGVYVGASPEGETGGILQMTGGGIYLNVAGDNGNTSSGADDAGADVYSEGGNAFISVVTAMQVNDYIHDTANRFVPVRHRGLTFTNWYDDYSDQDPDYGKSDAKTGTGVNTGRYRTSIVPDRMVYTPQPKDGRYNALILDYETPAMPRTGDDTPLWAYAAMMALSAVAMCVAASRRKANQQP